MTNLTSLQENFVKDDVSTWFKILINHRNTRTGKMPVPQEFFFDTTTIFLFHPLLSEPPQLTPHVHQVSPTHHPQF